MAPRPWDPGISSDQGLEADAARLLYVVVEEKVGEWRGLSVSAWPDADSDGRLRFTSAVGPLEIATTNRALAGFLYSDESRDVPIGVVFAARVKEGTAHDFLRRWEEDAETSIAELRNLEAWLDRATVITGEAREVAKLAYYSAILSTLPEKLESEWGITDEGETR